VSDTEREVVFEKKQNKASPFISFKAMEMIKESLLDTWLLKELSTWTFHIPSLILSLNLISHVSLFSCLCLFMGFWPVVMNQDGTDHIQTNNFDSVHFFALFLSLRSHKVIHITCK